MQIPVPIDITHREIHRHCILQHPTIGKQLVSGRFRLGVYLLSTEKDRHFA